jgi:hypothetical protein
MPYHTALERQETDIHYFSGTIQGQLDAFFRFPFPDGQARLEREEVNEPFLPCLIWSDEDEGEDEDEGNLDLEESEWEWEVQVSHRQPHSLFYLTSAVVDP